LSSTHLATFAGNVADVRSFQGEVNLDGPKKSGDLPKENAYCSVVCLISILLIRLKVSPTKGKKVIDVGSILSVASLRRGFRARRISLSM